MDGNFANGSSSVYQPSPAESSAVPRLFKLSFYDDEEETEVVECYGVAFPDGSAGTMSPDRGSFGGWISPETAERRHMGELTWLS